MGTTRDRDMFSSLRRLAQTGGMVPRSIRQSQRQLCTKPTKPKVEVAPGLSPAGIGPGQHQNRTASRGPLGWASLSLAALVGGAFVFYFRKEKERLTQQRMGRTDSHGNPLLGGPFELFDGDGKIHKSEEYLGKYMLVYFGFTNCPDICPAELDKMATIVTNLDGMEDVGPQMVQPIFITIDPTRDTPAIMKEYTKEFPSSYPGLKRRRRNTKSRCEEIPRVLQHPR